MPPTLTRSLPPQAAASPGRTAAGWAAAGIAALVAAVGAGEVLHPPATVDLVVVNESASEVTVVVAGGRGGAFPIATLDAGEERAVDGVLDRGGEWVVSFLAGGEPIGSEELSGDELEADGNRITVPADEAVAEDGEGTSG